MPNNASTTNKPDEEEIAERDRQAQSGIDEDLEEERQGMRDKTSAPTPELENDDDEHVDDEGVLEPDDDRVEGDEKPQTNV